MLNEEILEDLAMELLREAMIHPTDDVQTALDNAAQMESGRASEMYDLYYSVKDDLIGRGQMGCPDTGNLTFFIALGGGADVDPDLDWWRTIRRATERLTADEGFYKPLLMDLVTQENFGTNCGMNMPYIRFQIVPGSDQIEITASPKGGGAEPYTDYKVLAPTDGVSGIRKFILDCTMRGLQSGKTCPPNIIGVGIGGDAAIANDLAMQACVLRPVGSRHQVKWISEFEEQLKQDINDLGIGPMGATGAVSVYDVHIEYAFGHMIVMPVAFNIQCFIAHRASVLVSGDTIERIPYPKMWFDGFRSSVDYYLERSAVSPGLAEVEGLRRTVIPVRSESTEANS